MVGLRRNHRDPVGEAEVGDELVQLRDLVIAFEPARPADDEQPRKAPTPRLETGEGLDRDIGPLQRLNTTDEEQHRFLAEPERLTGAAARTGGEERVIDARGHDLDAR